MMVRLSAEAERDLEAIGDHIARDDPFRAVSYVQELRARCAALTEMPERFPLAPRYAAQGVRRCLHGHYLIFYRVDPAAVVILHVVHGAQDYDAILLS